MLKLMKNFAGYNMTAFRKDLVSGIIVGIIALPLGMAFAIASGVKPEYGLYTTIVAGILISLLGGSRFQIGGPTGAFIPILFAIVMQYGYENLLVAGFLAGVILVLLGIFKLGSLITFIPRPVTVGFTAGIAVIIFSGQIANFLGLTGVERHEYFLQNMKEIALHIFSVNLYSVIVAVVCLLVVILTAVFLPKVPGSLLGIVISTLVAVFFFKGEVATIGSMYGNIPDSLPKLQFPDLSLSNISLMLGPAFTIAMLGGIESLLSAVVADGMTGTRHNSNRELIGQGVANIVTPLFGGIPATGAIARTATNIKSGAVSPLSGVIHGFVVLAILLLFAPYASHIPLASLAPILMVVAWNMSGLRGFIRLLKTKTTDSVVLMATFLLTVFTNLTISIPAGLVLAAILFVKQMKDDLVVTERFPMRAGEQGKRHAVSVTETLHCEQIRMYSVKGTLFFGSADSFEKSIVLPTMPKILVLEMSRVSLMDTTGVAHLSSIVHRMQQISGKIVISGLQPQPMTMLQRARLINVIGKEHFFELENEAIQFALDELDPNLCESCAHAESCEFTAKSAGELVETSEDSRLEDEVSETEHLQDVKG